jgi:hypothetical protein
MRWAEATTAHPTFEPHVYVAVDQLVALQGLAQACPPPLILLLGPGFAVGQVKVVVGLRGVVIGPDFVDPESYDLIVRVFVGFLAALHAS